MSACEDLAEAPRDIAALPPTDGCAECLAVGSRDWVHLRICLDCGHIGCCDNSPQRHATAHFHNSSHPVIRSFEPGEEWRWCYVHEAMD